MDNRQSNRNKNYELNKRSRKFLFQEKCMKISLTKHTDRHFFQRAIHIDTKRYLQQIGIFSSPSSSIHLFHSIFSHFFFAFTSNSASIISFYSQARKKTVRNGKTHFLVGLYLYVQLGSIFFFPIISRLHFFSSFPPIHSRLISICQCQ